MPISFLSVAFIFVEGFLGDGVTRLILMVYIMTVTFTCLMYMIDNG